MFLFCGGYWPIRKQSQADQKFQKDKNTFLLSINEDEETVFSEMQQLESAFINMFNIDTRWEEMNDNDLSHWLETIHSNGLDIMEMTNFWEKEMNDIEE